MAKRKSFAKKALKVRGGFASSTNRMPKAFVKPMKKAFVSGPLGKDVKGRIASMALNTLIDGGYSKLANGAIKGLKDYAVREGVRAVLSPKTDTTNGKVEMEKMASLFEQTSRKRVGNDRAASNPSYCYKVKLDSGNPTSKSIKRYMANNGSKELTLSDSLRSSQYKNGVGNNREFSVIKAGFNQKIFYVNEDFQVSLQEMGDVYDLAATNSIAATEQWAQQVAYGLSSKLVEKLSFCNLNTYNALDLKVHLIASKATKAEVYEPNSAFNVIRHLTGRPVDSTFTYNDYIGLNNIIVQAAPYPDFAGSPANTKAYYCLVDPKTTIRGSNVFNEAHEVVHTFGQRLQPGDRLDMTNEIGLGAGVILNDLYTRLRFVDSIPNQDSSDIALIYTYVIEVVGQKCIGYTLTGPDANEPYQGTSPLTLSTEHSQKVHVGLQNIRSQNANVGSGWSDIRYAVKVFTTNDFENDTVDNIIFNKNYNDANFVVRSVSDNTVVNASPIIP